MEIEAKVWKVNDSKWLKATASITINKSFVVKDIKIIESKNGLFVSMPNRKSSNGEYKDIFFPITAEARQQINDAILKEFNGETQEETYQSDDILPF